jgi:hypothetical protein
MAETIRPEDWWPVDPAWQGLYESMVAAGSATARELDACVVMLCRNSMPYLANTCVLLRELSERFRECHHLWLENDSTDGTDEAMETLREVVAGPTVTVETRHLTLGALDRRGFDRERTERLARLRNHCLDWVRENHRRTAWTIVLDSDPHGGFSVDGVMNSIAWLGALGCRQEALPVGGMASNGVMRAKRVYADQTGVGPLGLFSYDGWAARQNDWRDRRDEVGFSWFFTNLPPVGSTPIPMLSAFSGLCVYRTEAFIAGGYVGDDCEHVGHHRKMREAGYSMYLNPGCRYVAY